VEHVAIQNLSFGTVPGVRMTTIDGDAPTPVFVSVRPHVRESATGASDEKAERLAMPESGRWSTVTVESTTTFGISVTDRCNLRCVYCMPEVGMTFQPRDALLTFDEMIRVARVARELGITAIRLTGGEPARSKESALTRPTTIGARFDDLALTRTPCCSRQW